MANLSNINNKFLVTTGGNVLIGQTAAVGSSILQVTGDSTFTGLVTIPALADGNKLTITSSASSNHNIIEMGQLGSDGFLDVSAAGGNIITHLSGYSGYASYFLSNVGIGTDDPDHLLDLYKSTSTTSSTTGTTLQRLWNYVGTDINQQKTFIDFVFQDNNSNEYPQVRIGAEVGQNGDANTQEKEGSGAFVVYTNNATGVGPGSPTGLAERFRVDYAGNVGIGTTSPGGKLQITSPDVGSVRSYTTSNGFGLIFDQYYSAAAEPGASYTRTADMVASTGDVSSSQIRFLTKPASSNPAVAMLISGNGNVGIGTATPQKKVHIEGTGGASEMQILVSGASDTVGHTAGIGLRAEGGEADSDARIKCGIFFERIAGSFGNGKMILAVNSGVNNNSVTVADHALTIDNNKNVGIGTTSPTGGKLQIEGADDTSLLHLSLSGGYLKGSLEIDDPYFVVKSTSNTTGGIKFRTITGGTTYDRMTILNSGKVGIGTTSPGSPLEIAAESTNVGNTLLSIGNAILNPNTRDSWIKMYGSQATVDKTFAVGNMYGKFVVNYLGTRATNPESGGTKMFTVDGSTGYVGIGTTGPAAKLDVAGIIRSKGNNNYENILTKEGSTGSFTFSSTELGAGIVDNVSYFIFVSVYRPTTDVANDVGTLLLHGIMPRGGNSVFNTINTLKGSGIAVLTATNSGNSLVITTDSNVNLRCAIKLISIGGTS
jgi:hypothetical protein